MPVSLMELIEIVFRHKWKWSATWCSVVALTLLAIIVWPRTYQSNAKLLIRMGREALNVGPAVDMRNAIAMQKSTEEEVNTVLAMFSSRVIGEMVVDELGPEAILYPPPAAGEAAETKAANASLSGSIKSTAKGCAKFLSQKLDTVLLATGIRDDLSLREEAIQRLSKTLKGSATRKSAILTISCKSKTPESAQRIVSTAVRLLQGEHLDANRTDGTVEFFDEEVTGAHREVELLSQQLSQRRNEIGVVDIAAAKKQLQTQMTTVESDILANLQGLKSVSSDVEFYTVLEAELPERVLSQAVLTRSARRAQLEQKKTEIEIELSLAEQKYGVRHDKFQQLARQHKRVVEMLDAAPEHDNGSETHTTNPDWTDAKKKLSEARAKFAALTKKRQTLDDQRERLKAKASQLNEDEIELSSIVRALTTAETSLKESKERLEKARRDEELRENEISSINVTQAASFVERPVSPNKRLTLAAGVLFATGFATLVALLFEHLFGVRSERSMLPVIVDAPARRVPEHSRHSESRRRHSRPRRITTVRSKRKSRSRRSVGK